MDDFLTQLMAFAQENAVEAEEEFKSYQSRNYKAGIYETKIELNINLPGATWEEEMHRVQERRGLYAVTEDGGKNFESRYPKTLSEYMSFLTAMCSQNQLGPFEQLCVAVRFWDPEYKFTEITVYEDGIPKRMKVGSYTKWIKWGKDEEFEITFSPFNPIRFLYFQPRNKGFRALIDRWKNVEKGGLEELLRRAAEEVFERK